MPPSAPSTTRSKPSAAIALGASGTTAAMAMATTASLTNLILAPRQRRYDEVSVPPGRRLPLLLGKRPFELAVAVELDLGVTLFDLADDVHHVAAADDGGRLDDAVLAESGLEATLGATFLLEPTLDRIAVDGDVD